MNVQLHLLGELRLVQFVCQLGDDEHRPATRGHRLCYHNACKYARACTPAHVRPRKYARMQCASVHILPTSFKMHSDTSAHLQPSVRFERRMSEYLARNDGVW